MPSYLLDSKSRLRSNGVIRTGVYSKISAPAPDYFFQENFGGPYSGFDNGPGSVATWTNYGANPNKTGVSGMEGSCLETIEIDEENYTAADLIRTNPLDWRRDVYGYQKWRNTRAQGATFLEIWIYSELPLFPNPVTIDWRFRLSVFNGNLQLYSLRNGQSAITTAGTMLNNTTVNLWWGFIRNDAKLWAGYSLDGTKPAEGSATRCSLVGANTPELEFHEITHFWYYSKNETVWHDKLRMSWTDSIGNNPP